MTLILSIPLFFVTFRAGQHR
uniref:Uncharacterized protein n=1 Tax=Anguilla anguilla TaxID=7936 RepID=A0A0E9THZ3_ANGAN